MIREPLLFSPTVKFNTLPVELRGEEGRLSIHFSPQEKEVFFFFSKLKNTKPSRGCATLVHPPRNKQTKNITPHHRHRHTMCNASLLGTTQFAFDTPTPPHPPRNYGKRLVYKMVPKLDVLSRPNANFGGGGKKVNRRKKKKKRKKKIPPLLREGVQGFRLSS